MGDVLDVRGPVSKTSLCHKSLPVVLNILSEVTMTVVLVFQMRDKGTQWAAVDRVLARDSHSCLATADGAECQGKPFDALDQEPCRYLGTSS